MSGISRDSAGREVYQVDYTGMVPLQSLSRSGAGLPAATLAATSSATALSQFIGSTAIVILSDSTGIQPTPTTAWPYLLGQDYAATSPSAAILPRFWNDTNQDYDNFTNITANEERYINITTRDALGRTRYSDRTQWGSYTDIDIRVDCAPQTWVPATFASLVAQWSGSAGTNGHRLVLRNDGKLEFDFTTDGTTTISALSSVATGFGANVRKQLRVTRLGSSGAVNFYTRDPGTTTWTQLGSANVSSATGTIATVARDYEVGGHGNSAVIPGKYYGVEYRAAIGDGRIVNPQPIESWYQNEDNSPTAGAPTLYMWIGAKTGADSAYLTDSTRGPRLVPPHQIPVIGMINNGHNELYTTSFSAYLTSHDGFKTLLNSQCPGNHTILMTQNPRSTSVFYAEQQRHKMSWAQAWALKNNIPIIDVYGAFLKDSAGVAGNLEATGLHPNAAGAILWEKTIRNRMMA